ncbi:unnamed protein product [Moneuplotes crassus]|uniref:Uncharacterized protein n=1 Tax=Euplotes crassus TaxID=5936 RepID=A0AAD1X5H8_EUPCR|nr:unnamed protein product [Moneuplotes crassus]
MENAVAEKIRSFYNKPKKQRLFSLSPPKSALPTLKEVKSRRLKEFDVQQWMKKRRSKLKFSENNNELGNDEGSVEELSSWRTKSKESLHSKVSANQSKELKPSDVVGKVKIETFKMEIKTYLNCTHKKLMVADLSKMKKGDEEYLKSLNSKKNNRRGVLSPGVYRPSKLLEENTSRARGALSSMAPHVNVIMNNQNVRKRKEVVLKKNPQLKKFIIERKAKKQNPALNRIVKSPCPMKSKKHKSYFKDNIKLLDREKLKNINPASKNISILRTENLKSDFKGKIKSPRKLHLKIDDGRMKKYLKSILPELPSHREEIAKNRPKIVIEEN